jgi:NitT/TauT family transport system ATP-binding protein
MILAEELNANPSATTGTESRALIDIQGVHKRFGNGRTILEDVSLKANPGDFISLIGPSGCGKSTLLKLVSGLTPISSGNIVVDGMSPANARELMSFIFQDATLLPWRTVIRNVELGLELENTTTDTECREKALALLKLVGLSDVANHYPRQLSGGMKMRVSIARALATRPKVLLMDEPFGALDEMTREHLNEELLDIRQQQAWTTFFVTHSVAEAVFLSNRILVMSANPGRIHREVRVDFPYPRTEVTRLSRPYHDLVTEVSRLLRSVESA